MPTRRHYRPFQRQRRARRTKLVRQYMRECQRNSALRSSSELTDEIRMNILSYLYGVNPEFPSEDILNLLSAIDMLTRDTLVYFRLEQTPILEITSGNYVFRIQKHERNYYMITSINGQEFEEIITDNREELVEMIISYPITSIDSIRMQVSPTRWLRRY